MSLVLALVLGALIGVTIGALGGGGSILTVPVLVYLVDLDAQEATAASLVIVGITSGAAAAVAAREGRTRWRVALGLAVVGIPASVAGAQLNHRVADDVLLLAFAAIMLVVGVGMLSRQSPAPEGRAAAQGRFARALRVGGAGLLVGFLTGFLGVGGGFVVVPVLVLALGLTMLAAVATSLVVITLNSVVALVARAGNDTFVWDVIVPFTAAAVLGALVGKRLADRTSAAGLTRAFGLLLLAVAAYVAVRATLALG